MGLKQKRINSLIMKTVSEIIEQEIKDPRMGLVTITSSSTSPDFKHSTIFFTVHGGEEEGKKNAKILNHAAGFIQYELSNRLKLRYTPKLHFKYDPVYERMDRIETLLKKEDE